MKDVFDVKRSADSDDVLKKVNGQYIGVVDITAATYTVEDIQSGTHFTLNKADGIVVTLPVAEPGLTYTFSIGTTFTGTFSLDAAQTSDLYIGTLIMSDKDAPGTVSLKQFHPDGSDDDKIVMDGDDNGRFVGGIIKLTCTALNRWHVDGYVFGDGTLVTPFA